MSHNNLPFGVTLAMIDAIHGAEPPCGVCGKSADNCICPECPVCQTQGDPRCYDEHGLIRAAEQVISKQEHDAAQRADAASWAEIMRDEAEIKGWYRE